jgi:putative endonuclease
MINRVAVGRTAEELAADLLEENGFRIVWRNLRMGPLELDLVAKKEDLVLIVEVRSRRERGARGPLAGIGWTKQRMLLRAARGLWRSRLKKMPEVQRVRIDVVAIVNGPCGAELEWIQGALVE